MSELNEYRIVRLPEILRMTGLCRATIYQYRKGGTFPEPLKLGPKAVGWRLNDILVWIDGRSRVCTSNGNAYYVGKQVG